VALRPISRVVFPRPLDREVSLLKKMCSFAEEAKLIKRNPLAGVAMLNEPNVRKMIVDDEAFERLYEASDSFLRPIIFVRLPHRYAPSRDSESVVESG
jgi:hypothetical protein